MSAQFSISSGTTEWIGSLMELPVTGAAIGAEINTISKHAKATDAAFNGPPSLPKDNGASNTSFLPSSNDIATGILKARARHMMETPIMALNAVEDPSNSRPKRS
jgi:hypothetical protein